MGMEDGGSGGLWYEGGRGQGWLKDRKQGWGVLVGAEREDGK